MKVPSYRALRVDYDAGITRIKLEAEGVAYLYTVPAALAWRMSYLQWQMDEIIRGEEVQRVAEY